jgi:hypothetical protein
MCLFSALSGSSVVNYPEDAIKNQAIELAKSYCVWLCCPEPVLASPCNLRGSCSCQTILYK